MVTPNARRNRGQVILIGAITLAFILLGIVVVFNGVLYTETISESSTSQSTADAEMVAEGLERNLVEIAHRRNLNGNDPYKFADEITAIDGFRDQYRNTTANSRSVSVNADEVSIETEAAIVVDEPIGDPPQDINVSGSQIGYLVLDLDANDGDDITIETDPGSKDVSIESDSNSFEVDGCEIESDEVRFDLVTGKTDSRSAVDCDPDKLQEKLSIIDSSTMYDEIVLTGDDLGTYDIVVRDGFGDNPNKDHDGIWKIEADITYESTQVSYERTDATIEVYGDNG